MQIVDKLLYIQKRQCYTVNYAEVLCPFVQQQLQEPFIRLR